MLRTPDIPALVLLDQLFLDAGLDGPENGASADAGVFGNVILRLGTPRMRGIVRELMHAVDHDVFVHAQIEFDADRVVDRREAGLQAVTPPSQHVAHGFHNLILHARRVCRSPRYPLAAMARRPEDF